MVFPWFKIAENKFLGDIDVETIDLVASKYHDTI